MILVQRIDFGHFYRVKFLKPKIPSHLKTILWAKIVDEFDVFDNLWSRRMAV